MKLSYIVNKPAPVVFDYLADIQKFVSVHPVITKIERLKENHYIVFETMKVGFIPFSFTYPVTVNSNIEALKVNIKATVMKLAFIEMNFKIVPENSSAIIHEEINVKTVLPIRSLIKMIFIKQHKQLFLKIEKATF